jgi:hypothetical protein
MRGSGARVKSSGDRKFAALPVKLSRMAPRE